jgi:hypothetical protein
VPAARGLLPLLRIPLLLPPPEQASREHHERLFYSAQPTRVLAFSPVLWRMLAFRHVL